MSRTSRHVEVDISGYAATLPVVALDEQTAIALLLCVDLGVSFTEHAGRSLAALLGDLDVEVVVSIATMGLPLGIEVTRALGLDHYVLLHKTNKIHLHDAMTAPVRSITTGDPQLLRLDRARAHLLSSRRVAIIDDVISTGNSMAAACSLVDEAGGDLVALGAIATEGNSWRQALGERAPLVRALTELALLRP